jgi:uncharacterized protein YndB with AHSA1/START domain
MALWGLWKFHEIQTPEKIVLIQHFSNAQGNVAPNPWDASWPIQTRSTTTLTEQDGGTLLTIEWVPNDATEQEKATFLAGHASMGQGWSSVLDRLEAYLPLLQLK